MPLNDLTLIDLLAIEYRAIFPGRKKTPTDFNDEIIALCSLLDKRQVIKPGASGLPTTPSPHRRFRPRIAEPEELEVVNLADLGLEIVEE